MKVKKVLALVLSVAMISSLVACGNAASETQTAGSDTQQAETKTEETKAEETTTAASDVTDTITIMVPPITGDYVDLLGGWISDFNQEYPNIKIDVISTSWDDHTEKLTTMALAGEAPDIAEVSYAAIGSYVENGTAIDISKYIDPERLSDYDQNALDYMTLEGTLYGLPLYITIQALGGNREMLEAAGADVTKIQTSGWTYDQFLDVIKNGTTSDRFGFVFANAGATTQDFINIFGVAAGITSSFTQDLKYSYTSDNMLSLLEAVETMTSSGYMPNYAVEAGQRLVMLQTGQTMLTGKAMPLFENNIKRNIEKMQAKDPEAVEGTIEMEYVFLPVPTMENATASVFGTVDGMIALRNNNTTDEHLQNVLKFMDFLCSGERAATVDNAVYLTGVCESARKAQESFELDQSDENAAAVAYAISKVVAPPTGISAEQSANAKTMMDETIVPKFQALLAGETTAKDVYDAICTEAYKLFGEENCASGWIK
ncbi:multiple sugar transport system substrate-binding protein [Butyrivibrio proteoclasticus]|uniref:Multiple sugar transport system substrate-binding protein n=1 Tax=Butyrivibrio proteoclasticus TaxID=43305 RepID=A0A1I5V8S6_9FIRM|nr:extracellular solute-binding protein [Butyrivibrio proteoclasticus]SFQ03899.1 multiple sugar transport system substrate-binding protein [Butyrivibrio proteoclasticus]